MRRFFLGLFCLLLAGYAATGLYEVKPEESAVAYRFGRIVDRQVTSGIHWNFPPPIGRQVSMPTRLNQVLQVGYGGPRVSPANLPRRESLWLTGGTSVVECRLDIQFRIAALDQFLLSYDEPNDIMRLVAERAVTRFLAGLHVDDILTTKRQALAEEVGAALQDALDRYELGVQILDVSIGHLAPPVTGGVSNAFRQVQSARSERDRETENARSEASRIVFDAEAEAESIRSESLASQYSRVQRASAEAARFRALARERALAPGITETRLYRDLLPAALRRAKIYVVPNDDANRVNVE